MAWEVSPNSAKFWDRSSCRMIHWRDVGAMAYLSTVHQCRYLYVTYRWKRQIGGSSSLTHARRHLVHLCIVADLSYFPHNTVQSPPGYDRRSQSGCFVVHPMIFARCKCEGSFAAIGVPRVWKPSGMEFDGKHGRIMI